MYVAEVFYYHCRVLIEVIANEAGETLGYIAEEPRGFFSMFSRQIFRTHRPFRALVMDRFGDPILWVSQTVLRTAAPIHVV